MIGIGVGFRELFFSVNTSVDEIGTEAARLDDEYIDIEGG